MPIPTPTHIVTEFEAQDIDVHISQIGDDAAAVLTAITAQGRIAISMPITVLQHLSERTTRELSRVKPASGLR